MLHRKFMRDVFTSSAPTTTVIESPDEGFTRKLFSPLRSAVLSRTSFPDCTRTAPLLSAMMWMKAVVPALPGTLSAPALVLPQSADFLVTAYRPPIGFAQAFVGSSWALAVSRPVMKTILDSRIFNMAATLRERPHAKATVYI